LFLLDKKMCKQEKTLRHCYRQIAWVPLITNQRYFVTRQETF
jgi:hypothetical protein